MKNFIISLGTITLFLATSMQSQAAVTKTAIKETATVKTTMTEPKATSTVTAESLAVAKNNFYVSVNFIDLTKGNANLNADLFTSENIAANFRVLTSSNREEVKNPENRNQKAKLTVDRTYFAIGASFFPMGLQQKINLMVTPGLAFGTKKSPLDVENQSGLSMKVSALFKTNNRLAVEFGLRGDNLENSSFTSDLYAGFGLLF